MRYLPHTDTDREAMLKAIGVKSIDDLFEDVPESARLPGPLQDLAPHASEMTVERRMAEMAGRNRSAGEGPFFVGCGAYRHHVPATVDHIIQRSEFLTTYTPYQPEIAQGTLQSLFEFQTQVALLLDMDVANASLYDGSTAAAEAALMARRVTKRDKVVLSGGLHPHYSEVIRTLCGEAVEQPKADPLGAGGVAELIDEQTACVIVQSPDVFGHLRDVSKLADAAHKAGALLVSVTTEIVALGAVRAPGTQGADIAVAEGQSLGNALNFGGPYVGLFGCRDKLIRQAPGRLAGETVDADGERGFVLTLSTREQHIRRDKATSNICTNSGLCALAFSAHMSLLGEVGLRKLAALNHARAVQTREAILDIDGISPLTETFFNEFAVHLIRSADEVVNKLAQDGIFAGVPARRLYPEREDLDGVLILAATEMTSDHDIKTLADGLKEALA